MRDTSPLGLGFTLEVDAPMDLPCDEQRADALITVRAAPSARSAEPAPAAQILIMDRSLSMSGHRLDEAKRAMCAAIDTLRDGTLLAVVAGNNRSDLVFPVADGLARVDSRTREEAKLRVAGQFAEGGTAIGQWLLHARRLFASVDSPAVRHAVLYTDGKNEHETPEQLDEILTSCTDRFTCHARGLGEDWNLGELLRVAEALHGTAEAVVTVSDLTQDFTRLIRQAQRIVVPRVYLGLRLNSRFQLASVRQTRPLDVELTARQPRDDGETHVPLGSWSPETRQYQVSLRFAPDSLTVDETLRAARITLHAEYPDGTRGPCTETEAMAVCRRSAPGFDIARSPDHTRVEDERELGMAMRACADAQLRGDLERADQELRLAIDLGESLGDIARLRLLYAVADEGPDGLRRVRRDVSRGQILSIGVDSTKTASGPVDPDELPFPDAGSTRWCPRCRAVSSVPGARFCEECRHEFGSAGGPVDVL